MLQIKFPEGILERSKDPGVELFPIDLLVQISIHLPKENLGGKTDKILHLFKITHPQPLLGLLRGQVIIFLSVLPRSQDRFVVEGVVVFFA